MNLRKALLALVLALAPVQVFGQATLLPLGEQCFQATAGSSGMVGTLGAITGGSLYTAGTYANVALTGGSGSGATANITVAGGAVTVVAILNPGTKYVVGDTLSAAAATIGGTGAGFSVSILSVSINSSLAGGTVGYYQPNTLIFKQTWQDAAQTTLNTNPVQLDQNGCATVYGAGSYRQIVQDSLSNVVWDKLTYSTNSTSPFWAGTAGGTPNVITITDPSFAGTDGTIIEFIVLATNTGSATLNPSSFGAIVIQKDTTAGPVALSGGELTAGNIASVLYSASGNVFHLLNTVIASASGSSAPLCGTVGLSIANNSGTPNTSIDVSFSAATLVSSGGIAFSTASSTSFTINSTSSGSVNQWDGTRPTSDWGYVWIIGNGSSFGGLGSNSSTAPTLPSGYTYKCRAGAMRFDGSQNLLRTKQLGNRAQYVITAATNTTATPTIDTGIKGLNCGTAAPTWATPSVSSVVPPTASQLNLLIDDNRGAAGVANVQFAPNSGYVGVTSASPPWAFIAGGTVGNFLMPASILLEGATVAWCSSAAGGAISATGWVDRVNAN